MDSVLVEPFVTATTAAYHYPGSQVDTMLELHRSSVPRSSYIQDRASGTMPNLRFFDMEAEFFSAAGLSRPKFTLPLGQRRHTREQFQNRRRARGTEDVASGAMTKTRNRRMPLVQQKRSTTATINESQQRKNVHFMLQREQEAEQEQRDELSFERLSTRAVYRVQLLTSFVDLYLSGDCIAAYQNSDLASLPGLDFASSTLQAAADTICFVGLGAAYEDQRLVAEARLRYGYALQLLSSELGKQRPRKDRFRFIVTSIMLLRMCELFDALSNGEATMQHKGWHWHLAAVMDYMRQCGPKDLLHTDFDWELFQNIRHYTFYFDILRKTSSLFAEPEWLAMTEERAKIDPAVSLYNLRAQLPGLLARVETAVAQWTETPTGTPEMFKAFKVLHTDLHWLRTALANWMLTSGDMFKTSDKLDPTGPSVDPRAYELDLLRTSFQFSSVEKAGQCTTCWMLCLMVDNAISSLLAAQKSSDLTMIGLNQARAVVERDAYVCATNLCRSLNWCCQVDVARFPSVGLFHLIVVKRYFQKAGLHRELKWCEATGNAIDVRMEDSTRGTFPRICGLIAAEQFKSLCK